MAAKLGFLRNLRLADGRCIWPIPASIPGYTQNA